MKVFAFIATAGLAQVLTAVATNPIAKVLDLLSGLQAKLAEEKATAQKTFEEFSEWCEDHAKTLEYEIETGKKESEGLNAAIEQETASASSLTAKIDDLSGALAADSSDAKAASEIRAKEAADFTASDKELVEIIDTLRRAVGLLEREMRKRPGGAAFLQRQFSGVSQALSAMVEASVLSTADVSKLTSLLQDSQNADTDADLDSAELGAPAAAVYQGHSRGIIDTLEGLLEKAQEQLTATRKAETNARHNFELLKQGLDDQIKQGTTDAADAKKALAVSGENKASAQGDLAMTSKELNSDTHGLADLNQDCMMKAQNHEAADKSRGEELEALAAAKKAVTDMTSGAASSSYSLLQVDRSKIASRTDLVNFEAVRFVRDLARKNGNDPILAQLAERMASAVRISSGADPFSKVKGLISAMIDRLESDAGSDSSQKAYCDKELAESTAKKSDNEASIDKLSTKIDQMSSRFAQLKEQIASLSDGLAKLATFRAESTQIRQEEKSGFVANKAELEQGIEGVKMALKVLRDYYATDQAHDAADGSSGIVGLLEVCESDFTNGLATAVATEEEAARSYEQSEKEDAIEKVTKQQDIAYKTKETKKLDKAMAEATTDRTGVATQLDAVNEYLKQLEATCIAKAEPYAERAGRREAEIAGLKEALTILDGQSLLQKQDQRMLRGLRAHRF